MTTLQSAKKYEELLSGEVAAEPYDYPVMFKADGFFARQRAKWRFKLLKGIDPKLRRILRSDERVYYVTTGTTVSLAEHFFVGWFAHYLNLRALIFTTERVLLLEVSRNRPGKLVSQIPYAAIASVKSTWTGICRVKLLNKKTYDFQSVAKPDRKFLADFLADVVKGTNAPFQAELGLEHLCPHCYTLVPAHPLACPSCQGGIKSAKKAGLLSFIFPGLGDWYLGHRGRAVVELLGTGFLWLAFVIGPLLGGADPAVRQAPLDAAYWTTAAMILLGAHSIDAVMTHHFARKGHHPHPPFPTPVSGPPLLAK